MSDILRYPGRACLLGEHCDWAGGSSLTVPLPLGVQVEVEAGIGGIRAQSELNGQLLEGQWPLHGAVTKTNDPLRFVGAAARCLTAHGIGLQPCLLRFTSNLPAGRGFSSSAAFCLATLDGLARAAGHHFEAAELADLAFETENGLLGIACGRLDPLACAAGTPVFLRWTDGSAPIKRIRPGVPAILLLGSFSKPRNTPRILAALNSHFFGNSNEQLSADACHATRHAIQVFGTQAQIGAVALEQGDLLGLGEAMNATQNAYQELLEPHLPPLQAPQLREAVYTLKAHQALGAKFSGAGGDGSVIGLFDNHLDASIAGEQLKQKGVSIWIMDLGSEII